MNKFFFASLKMNKFFYVFSKLVMGYGLLVVGVLTLLLFAFSFPAIAAEKKAVTIVNPIRGQDFWSHPYGILDTPKKQYELINQNNLEATWLVRYDALTDANVDAFLKNLNNKQEVGVFLEITPTLTKDAGVTYNPSANWHTAKSILTIGYSPDDRKKLIDTVMTKYKQVFGNYPKSVGAWWIDAGSLQYLHDKYQVEANMDVSDQFSTDGYQVWGQYWSSPFYPSKRNALMPASSADQKIGMVTIQWANRDPFNGYGNGVFESTYSVQANDYMLHDLDNNYFNKLVDIYPQTTVGLENDFDWSKYGVEYTSQINYAKSLQPQAEVVTMDHFFQSYKTANPDISPQLVISADDPLGSDGKVVWYQTDKYRVGWFYNQEGVVIRDLRQFNDGVDEQCLNKACDSLKLGFTANQAIDEVNYGTKWVIDEGKISDFKLTQNKDDLQIEYKNGAGVNRTIHFLANDVKVDDKISTIPVAILQAVESSQNANNVINQPEKDFISKVEWSKVLPNLTSDSLKFLAFVLLFLILPGFVISRRWILSVPVGIASFTLAAFVLGWLKLDVLLWAVPVISVAVGLAFKVKPVRHNIGNIDWLAVVVIILGSISWLLTQVKNGLLFNYGYGYWGPNGHDAIWHLQLISALTKSVPPQNFVFAGQPLQNYHYFFDLLVAKSGQLFGMDFQNLLFRFFPLLISLWIGLMVYFLTKVLANKLNFSLHQQKAAANWALFLVYFGGSFGWLISFLRDRNFGGETSFWAQQSISTLLNPPFAISLLLFFAGAYLYYSSDFSHKKEVIKKGLALVLLWGTLIEFKAYAGILVLLALALISLVQLIKGRFWFLVISIPTVVLSLVVFLPNNSGSNSLITFSPLWLIESMVEFQDRLNWTRLLLTMQSGVWYKVWGAYAVGIIVFVIGNFGTRTVSLFNPKVYKFGLLSLMSLFGFLLSMLFLQVGTNWNIVQFFYYSLMIEAVLGGIVLAGFLRKLHIGLTISILVFVVLLTVPTSINTLSQYLPKRPPAKLSTAEIEATAKLSELPEGVVLSPVFDDKLNNNFGAPKPLFVYDSNAYVSAFSAQPSFVADEINLEILGIDYKGRINTAREILKGTTNSHILLVNNNITYLYIPKKSRVSVDEGKVGVEKVFENDDVSIYRVLKKTRIK